jgi:hypothetical protein
MLRPEAIRLVGTETGEPVLTGRVDASAFLGSYTRLVVVCDDVEAKVVVALQGQGRSGTAEVDSGTPVALSWMREEAVVLEEEAPKAETPEEEEKDR